MPTVPISQLAANSVPGGGAAAPNPTNLLLAAADMHRQGQLFDSQPTMPKGPALPAGSASGRAHRGGRKLKLVR